MTKEAREARLAKLAALCREEIPRLEAFEAAGKGYSKLATLADTRRVLGMMRKFLQEYETSKARLKPLT